MVNDIRSETLRELKESLETFLGDRLLRMILFGSMARGDYTDESDIDVAIIIRGLTRELKHQILDRVGEVELNHLMPVSALLLSEEEFNRLKKRACRIALDIEGEGVPLSMRKIKRLTSGKRSIGRMKQSELPIFCSRMDL